MKPVALRVVYEVAQVVKIPIVAIGGIGSLDDVLDFLFAGAVAVQVGTAVFADPVLPLRLVDELAEWCAANGHSSHLEIVGAALPEKRAKPSVKVVRVPAVTPRPRVALGVLLCSGGVALLLVIAAACSSAPPTPPPSVAPTAPPTGGTLRVAMDLAGYEAEFGVQDANGATTSTAGWDPAIAYDPRPWEIFRCCLLRTLMSYSGRSLQQGGAILQPDLATDYPSVSADGLTWTFRLRQGLHYAPPMADKEIVAQDVVRAIERALAPDPCAGGRELLRSRAVPRVRNRRWGRFRAGHGDVRSRDWKLPTTTPS